MYKGIITPMITPMGANGDIDYSATEILIDELASFGVDGLFPMGSTGLFPMFSKEEKKKFLSFVRDHSKKMEVYAGVGSSSTQESVELSKYTEDIGIKVRVLMPTYYIKPDEDWMYKHFSTVISAASNDLFIYNIPQLSGSWISESLLEKLSREFSNVKGIKDSSGDMRFFSRIIRHKSQKFDIFQGQDDLLFLSLSIGASGGVCGLSNISPYITDLYREFIAGNAGKAKEIQLNQVNPLMYTINEATFPSGYYYAFYKINNIKGGYRIPMLEPTPDQKRKIDQEIAKIPAKK
ncbi:dihydrodipicolinate synthase family protein [Thermoplasma sp.]|uniref:dihydrodipicolinate synthase family protein n=1 Tax=Thermoplasma sp. TaxID=1973142 RepID=UPI00126F8236|nr:dihydrodipicolinate synthase family protein [Thermoplasma sp.]KAA8922266.1 MAG: dihydrodipicolinate synthase family protein [Thermoplasma sp.]